MAKARTGDICVVIERKVVATEGLCKDCVARGLGSRWAMVRRYVVPAGSRFDKLFGVGEGSIQPKGRPDNISTGTAEFMRTTGGKRGILGSDCTAATHEMVASVVLGLDREDSRAMVAFADLDGGNDEYGGNDECWGLDLEWCDETPETPYRIVAWRIVPEQPNRDKCRDRGVADSAGAAE